STIGEQVDVLFLVRSLTARSDLIDRNALATSQARAITDQARNVLTSKSLLELNRPRPASRSCYRHVARGDVCQRLQRCLHAAGASGRGIVINSPRRQATK